MLPKNNERAWKANLLVPVRSSRELRGSFSLIKNLVYPRGSVSLIGFSDTEEDELTESLINLPSSFLNENTYERWSFIKSSIFQEAVIYFLQTLRGSFFSPNILFMRMMHDETHDEEIYNIISTTGMYNMGVQLYIEDTVAQLDRTASINVWMREKGPD